MSAFTISLIVIYIIGYFVFLWVVVPLMVQAVIGVSLYQACFFHPPSWPLGLPFLVVAQLVSLTWPIVLTAWLALGRPAPPLISSQALIEHLGAQYEGGPVLTRVPKDIPKRLAAHSIRTSKTYETAGDFWEEYLGKGS